MAELPVSANVLFSDFSFDLVDLSIYRNGSHIASSKGLFNKESRETYIHLPLNVDVAPGDVVKSSNGEYAVKSISTDTYLGKAELLRVFY